MTFPCRPLCAAAFCVRRILRKTAKWSRFCAEHRPKGLTCSFAGCPRPVRADNPHRRCKQHRPRPTHPCAEPGCSRLVSDAAERCRPHANALSSRARVPPKPPPPPEAPTKTPRHQLDRQRLWKKLNPKGPPCSRPGCENRLAQKPQGKGPPVCMECRIATGSVAANLKPGGGRPLRREAGGLFVARTPSTPPAPTSGSGSGS